MRIADPAQLKPPIESVAAFSCNSDTLARKLQAAPVDQFTTPGPARLGVIELRNGTTVGVVIHDRSGFAEILAPLSADIERTLVEAFTTLEVHVAQIQWIRDGIDKAAVIAAVEKLASDGTAGPSFRVDLAAQFAAAAEEMLLTSPEAQALTLLVIEVSRQPQLGATIGDTEIRMMRMERTVLADGSEIAPLAIFYRVITDEQAVVILDVQRMGASDAVINRGDSILQAINEMTESDRGHLDHRAAASVLQHRPRTLASAFLQASEMLRRAS